MCRPSEVFAYLVAPGIAAPAVLAVEGQAEVEPLIARYGTSVRPIVDDMIREGALEIRRATGKLRNLEEVAAAQEASGRVLALLDRSGLARNTIVIYTSDQGFFLADDHWGMVPVRLSGQR